MQKKAEAIAQEEEKQINFQNELLKIQEQIKKEKQEESLLQKELIETKYTRDELKNKKLEYI